MIECINWEICCPDCNAIVNDKEQPLLKKKKETIGEPDCDLNHIGFQRQAGMSKILNEYSFTFISIYTCNYTYYGYNYSYELGSACHFSWKN